MADQSITLYSLCQRIKEQLSDDFMESSWVVAEISELRLNKNGHCYLELVEKDAETDQIIARLKGIIWSYTYKMLRPYFETTTGQSLTAGIKVLVRCKVEFQEVYGLSLNIKDIDPSYTLGDLAQRKKQIIDQLREDGILEMNKEIELPKVIQRIAVISSATAAGYEDFSEQLSNNEHQFAFYKKLFPAIMQGEKAEESIINALEKIYQHDDLFDAVVIIRGGGSSTDLLCFDSYLLGLNIAQFPLPVFTGIGHERDTSIADLVAYEHLKTPTAVAEFVIAHNYRFSQILNEYKDAAAFFLSEKLNTEKNHLKKLASNFSPSVIRHLSKQNRIISRFARTLLSYSRQTIKDNNAQLNHQAEMLSIHSQQKIRTATIKLRHYASDLKKGSFQMIKSESQNLSNLQKQNHQFDPSTILQKGYSITYLNGKVVKSIKDINSGDELVTHLYKGSVTSTVK